MRFTPLSEIAELQDGTIIEGVKGTVKQVFKRREGEGQFGPYSYQDLELTDGELKVTVSVGNKENFVGFKGKFICILSGKDGKGKTSGITVNDNEYNGKVKRVLKTNTHAEFTETVPADQLQQPAAKPQPQPQPENPTNETAAQKLLRERKEAKERGEAPPETTTSPEKQNERISPKTRVGQKAHLMYLCRKAAFAIAAECFRANNMNQPGEESINSMAISMYIDSAREELDRGLETNFVKAKTE